MTGMRRGFVLISLLSAAVVSQVPAALAIIGMAFSAAALAADDSDLTPPIICGSTIPGGMNCVPTKEDLKKARQAYSRGVKFGASKHWEEAYEQFDQAARLAPRNVQFLNAREMLKAQMVFDHVERGNALLANRAAAGAATEYRAAVSLDPEDTFARERLQEAVRNLAPPPSVQPALMINNGEIHLQPPSEHATFHYDGDVHSLFLQIASAYGMKIQFDDSVKEHPVRFYVDDVDFLTALRLACKVSKTMWTALDARGLFIAADSPENHKQYDSMSLVTLEMPAHSSPQQATDLLTALGTICDLKSITKGQFDIVEARVPTTMVPGCTSLWRQLSRERPQVALDIQIFSIDHQLARNIGVHFPDTFNLYNIPAGALAALGGQNIQSLINQLISSGGINGAGSSSLSSLLSQLTGQSNSIFSQPLATFGGGLTLEGLSLDQLIATLSVNESWVRSLERMTLRASQGNDATFHVGSRYPILNASYAPIYNSPQISQVLGNQTYIPPFPSVSYEDLGLNVKTKPTIHANGDVTLTLEMQVRALTGQSANGVPVISNEEYQGGISLKDGESAVVAGQVSLSDQRSMSGIPGFGVFPGLNQIMVNNTVSREQDELMIIITPHVDSNTIPRTDEIWLSQN
jgi:general secretion pathway protein D